MTQIFDSIFYNVVENFENICTNKQNLETKEANSGDISGVWGWNVFSIIRALQYDTGPRRKS